MSRKSTIVIGVASALAALAACHSGDDSAPAPSPTALEGTTGPLPSELSPPSVYVAKVKNVLVGLPPTDEEVKRLRPQ